MTKPGDIIATIDIGSNAMRYRVFAYSVGLRPVEVDRARYPVQLGRGTFYNGRLDAADIDKAVDALITIARSAKGVGATQTLAVATSAIREAENGRELIDRAQAEAGIAIRVISGQEEARLAALGASAGGSNRDNACMIDIGGGSTEVVVLGSGAKIIRDASLPLGAVRMAKSWAIDGRPDPKVVELHTKEVLQIIEDGLSDYRGGLNTEVSECWALGGTPGALEQMLRSDAFKKNISVPDLRKGRTIGGELFEQLSAEIARHSADELHELFGVDSRRASLLLPGAIILRGILNHFQLPGFTPSDAGVCEGLAWSARSNATAQ